MRRYSLADLGIRRGNDDDQMGLKRPGHGPDECLFTRVRNEFEGARGSSERRMFGGVCFMVKGNTVCGVDEADLSVRMDKQLVERAMRRKYARTFNPTGRPASGFVRVLERGVKDKRSLQSWLTPAIAWVQSLPPKKTKKRIKVQLANSSRWGCSGFLLGI